MNYNVKRDKGADLLSALPPEKRREAGRATAKDLKEGTTRFYDEFLADGLKQDREEADQSGIQITDENSDGSTTPAQRRAAGKADAKATIEADPSVIELGPDPELDPEAQPAGSRNVIRFTSTKPNKNGLTPQQRKELGRQAARNAGRDHSGSGH